MDKTLKEFLTDQKFYWVQFTKESGWEIARWCAKTERFKFTDGSRSEKVHHIIGDGIEQPTNN